MSHKSENISISSNVSNETEKGNLSFIEKFYLRAIRDFFGIFTTTPRMR